MPREQPLAQDLMQEALSSKGSHVEQFLSPTIVPGQQASLYSAGCMRRQVQRPVKQPEQTGKAKYVSVHFNSLIFHSQHNRSNLCKSDLICPELMKSI